LKKKERMKSELHRNWMRILDAFSLNGGKVVRSGRYEGVLASLKFQRKTC
jgi:hypothetical protein